MADQNARRSEHVLVLSTHSGTLNAEVVCQSGPQAPCRTQWDCGCESWGVHEFTAGRPRHGLLGQDDQVQEWHQGVYRPDACGVIDWLTASGDELLDSLPDMVLGEVAFSAEWTGYALEARFGADAVLRPVGGGHPEALS